MDRGEPARERGPRPLKVLHSAEAGAPRPALRLLQRPSTVSQQAAWAVRPQCQHGSRARLPHQFSRRLHLRRGRVRPNHIQRGQVAQACDGAAPKLDAPLPPAQPIIRPSEYDELVGLPQRRAQRADGLVRISSAPPDARHPRTHTARCVPRLPFYQYAVSTDQPSSTSSQVQLATAYRAGGLCTTQAVECRL